MALKDRLKSLLASGRKVDVRERFEILREAISGTMSKFYVARDRKTNQIVGLKILDPEKTARFEARFKGLKKPNEGEIAVRFDHPYIVKTLEHGMTTKGEQYLVMEHLGGAGMDSVVANRGRVGEGKPILDGRRVQFLKQVGEALDTVHKAEFIHRDVCPRNLIFTEDNQTLKLTDFGLAVPATPPFMKPGNRTGTPEYMAPELVRRHPTDQRLDVFAFGVTAYEICTFQRPWSRRSTDVAAMAHAMTAMSHIAPPADIRQHRPQIHPDLARAIHACIEPEVKKRCPSIEEFLRAVRRIEHEDADPT
jgi:serine/threonine-protein kinase